MRSELSVQLTLSERGYFDFIRIGNSMFKVQLILLWSIRNLGSMNRINQRNTIQDTAVRFKMQRRKSNVRPETLLKDSLFSENNCHFYLSLLIPPYKQLSDPSTPPAVKIANPTHISMWVEVYDKKGIY